MRRWSLWASGAVIAAGAGRGSSEDRQERQIPPAASGPRHSDHFREAVPRPNLRLTMAGSTLVVSRSCNDGVSVRSSDIVANADVDPPIPKASVGQAARYVWPDRARAHVLGFGRCPAH